MSEEREIAYAQLIAGLMLADGTVTVAETMFLTRLMDRLGLESSRYRSLLMNSGGLAMINEAVAVLDAERRSSLLRDLEGAAIADGLKVDEEQEFIDEVALALASD